MLICFVLIRLIFARSKRLDIREKKKEIVSIIRLVYYMFIDNYTYKHVWDRRYRRYELDKILQQVHLGKLDVVDSQINDRLDMWEEQLGVFSASANVTLSTPGMAWDVSRTVFHLWMLPFMGVVIALIDCAHHLFTYPNFSLIQMNFYSLLATGVRISEALLNLVALVAQTKDGVPMSMMWCAFS